eukprot:3160767-Amphidinium_carterae.1
MEPSTGCFARQAVGQKLGGKPANWGSQRADKNQVQNSRGGGKRADKFDGWYCKHCDFYNFGYRPCLLRLQAGQGNKKDLPGAPAKNSTSMAAWAARYLYGDRVFDRGGTMLMWNVGCPCHAWCGTCNATACPTL